MSDGADTLAEIVTQIAAMQTGMTPPATAPKIAHAWDELPGGDMRFPCFVNLPRLIVNRTLASGTREDHIEIDMMLIFGAGEYKYATRAQRAWIPVVRDAFSRGVKLDNNAVQHANITSVNLDPIEIGDVPHTAITFRLECETSEPFTFEP